MISLKTIYKKTKFTQKIKIYKNLLKKVIDPRLIYNKKRNKMKIKKK